ncbi:unknown [Clostridium sp. CAG:413]|nr:unknown [Clostridium sp. CAG:413]
MAEAEKLSLPELTGSDKQIKWAISIRSDMLRKYSLSDGFAEGKTVDDLRTVIDDAIAGKIEATESDITWMRTALALLTETSAKWFIEHRYE